MAKAVLLDSGFLIRLMNPDEPLHPVAMRWFRGFVEQGVQCKVYDLLEQPGFGFIDIRENDFASE